MKSDQQVLVARHLTKVFPGVTALDDVSFDVRRGEVHCLIGENGAGKSTLLKCLTGVYRPEKGEVIIDGVDALGDQRGYAKVAYVPQEIDLFLDLTVGENLLIPFEKSGYTGPIRQGRINRIARPVIERFRINARPGDRARDLSVADQQLLQIARATMYADYEVLILDEPTSSLTAEDTSRVFSVVREQQAAGKAVIYISHKLEELPAIGDRVTVFRNGRRVAEAAIAEADENWIIEKMTGHNIDAGQQFAPRRTPGEVVLSVRHATGNGYFDVSFDLREGEILGFSGLVGAGRTELMLGLYGYDRLESGEVVLEGRRITRPDTVKSVQRGFMYLPEDRKRLGILPVMSVARNISILSLRSSMVGPLVSGRRERAQVREAMARYDVRAGAPETQIQYLSGGNQQKAIVARTMLPQPRVVIFDEPTKGIDVAAKYEIYSLLRSLAEEQRLAIILVSSELEEIKRCCNRVISMFQGAQVAEFNAPFNDEELVAAMFGRTNEKVESNA